MPKADNKVMKRDDTARIVADICGVSVSMVKQVRTGEKNNEKVTEALIEYQQGKSKLIEHLKEIIPIDKPIKSTGRVNRKQ